MSVEHELGKCGWTHGLALAFQPRRPACAWSLRAHSQSMGLLLASSLVPEDWDLVVGGGFSAFFLGGSFCVCVYDILINCFTQNTHGKTQMFGDTRDQPYI